MNYSYSFQQLVICPRICNCAHIITDDRHQVPRGEMLEEATSIIHILHPQISSKTNNNRYPVIKNHYFLYYFLDKTKCICTTAFKQKLGPAYSANAFLRLHYSKSCIRLIDKMHFYGYFQAKAASGI